MVSCAVVVVGVWAYTVAGCLPWLPWEEVPTDHLPAVCLSPLEDCAGIPPHWTARAIVRLFVGLPTDSNCTD